MDFKNIRLKSTTAFRHATFPARDPSKQTAQKQQSNGEEEEEEERHLKM